MGLRLGRMAVARPPVKQKPRVVVIAGATAVGKTELSLELCRRLRGEVVSADSVQVYRHADIASAKVDSAACSQVPHHLLNVVDVTEPFNALEYYHMAIAAIEDILSRGRVPLVVGGTGLYVRTLLQGPSGSPSSTPASREKIEEMVKEDGYDWEKSLQRLSAMDPTYAASIERNDWYRLKRALDICTLSGRTVTSFKTEVDEETLPYRYQGVFLTMPRSQLFHRIDSRCELIVEQGLFPEVISLVHDHGLVPDSPAGRSLGIRQALEWLKDTWGFPHEEKGRPYVLKIPKEDVRESFLGFLNTYKARTRSLARKQMVWYSKQPQFQWVNMAPGGKRLAAEEVGERVANWLLNDIPLPPEWDGEQLKTLSKDEEQYLRRYSSTHSQLEIFSDPARIDAIVHQIEACLQQTVDH